MNSVSLQKIGRKDLKSINFLRSMQDAVAYHGLSGFNFLDFLPPYDSESFFNACYFFKIGEDNVGFVKIHQKLYCEKESLSYTSFAYATFYPYRKQGVATHAYNELSNIIFVTNEIELIKLHIEHSNQVSKKIAMQIGYQEDEGFQDEKFGLYLKYRNR